MDNQPNFLRYKFYVQARILSGSRGYNLNRDDSDWDWRGFYVMPTHDMLGIHDAPEQISKPDADETYWELKKFCKLLIANNPNVLEVLFSLNTAEYFPFIAPQQREEFMKEIGVEEKVQELYANRHKILSRNCLNTYGGYAISQLKGGMADIGYDINRLDPNNLKLAYLKSPDQIATGWKHLSHLIRLLINVITILETGELSIRLEGGNREKVLAIKRQEMPIRDLLLTYYDLEKKFQALKESHSLREIPDIDWVNDWMIRYRRSML